MRREGKVKNKVKGERNSIKNNNNNNNKIE
jgi:hypothetical protein